MKREEIDVYTALLDAIDRGEYPAGTRLVETDLAERFKVSRTPVREALNRLESQGIAARDGKRGLTVASLDPHQLGELFDLREVMEGFSARLAARRASPVEIAILRDMVSDDLADETRHLPTTNKQFHQHLHRLSHNRYLENMLDSMRRSLVLLLGTSLNHPGRAEQSLDEHDQIVSAIEKRDEDAAEEAARLHIRNAYKARLKQMAEKEQDR